MLENIYSFELIREKPYIAFFLGIIYTIISIGIGVALHPKDPAIISIAFLSLLLIPTITKLLRKERDTLLIEPDLKDVILLKEQRRFILIYVLLFLSVFLTFIVFSMIMPQLAENGLFTSKTDVYYGGIGNAMQFNTQTFIELFTHNIGVLLLVFLTSLLIGDGAIFLITMNAYVWGTVFGQLALASTIPNLNPVVVGSLILLIVLPHTLLEALSYIIAAIAGGILSRTIIQEHEIDHKMKLLQGAIGLIILSLIVLACGMFIEELVLSNNGLYQNIINLAKF